MTSSRSDVLRQEAEDCARSSMHRSVMSQKADLIEAFARRWMAKEREQLDEALDTLIADWRERARRARPLESAPLTAKKRARTTEWMFYTNRANELEEARRGVPAPESSA